MIEEDLSGDGQPQTHSVSDFPGRDVWLENTRLNRRRDAGAAVTDVDEDAIGCPRNAKRHLAMGGRGACAVRAEIDQDLPEKVAVGFDDRIRRRENA